MNLLEFVKILFFKSVAIMQTNLCSADFEMLFWTLWTWRNTAKALRQEDSTKDDVTFSAKPRPHRFAEL